ncbi:hypothetical protein CDLVIII_3195 [Clostridium sp. DL-VIII]|uniref:hypothetical protein n=1 Tax=Clostridium sp. DL-VIII TaxID=641107 RepID=UPI00023AFFC8|nr:hypothetical protein [Clostridium sp. DL-VIII]EHI99769.1 hypothetical protein CDLVIII_3195 [Clostridium sp. DL-VIII]
MNNLAHDNCEYDYETSCAEEDYALRNFKIKLMDFCYKESFLDIPTSYKWNSIGLQSHRRKKEQLLNKLLFNNQDIYNFYDDSCLEYKKDVNPMPIRIIYDEVLDMDKKEYNKELFDEAYKLILEDAQDISEIETQNFIEHCETVYNMNSQEFIEIYENKNGEVNVEQQLWAMIIKNRNEADI